MLPHCEHLPGRTPKICGRQVNGSGNSERFAIGFHKPAAPSDAPTRRLPDRLVPSLHGQLPEAMMVDPHAWRESTTSGRTSTRFRRRPAVEPTVTDIAERHLEAHVKLNCRPNTVKAFGRILRLRIVPEMGGPELQQVDNGACR